MVPRLSEPVRTDSFAPVGGAGNGCAPGTLTVIRLTRLNDSPFIVNADLIKTIEERPDTTITLINGETLIVREKMKEVVARAVEYARMVRVFRP